MVTQQELKEVLSYDPLSGSLRWKTMLSPRGGVGQLAGCVNSDGYRRVGIRGQYYYASRIAWMYYYGEWPTQFIDHINGNRDDNRIANLRDVTCRQNHQNRPEHRKGRLPGCTRLQTGRWQAQISVQGCKSHLGYFETEQEAHVAYTKACDNLQEYEG